MYSSLLEVPPFVPTPIVHPAISHLDAYIFYMDPVKICASLENNSPTLLTHTHSFTLSPSLPKKYLESRDQVLVTQF